MASNDIKKHLALFESFAGDSFNDETHGLEEEFKDPRVAALVKAVRLKGCLPAGGAGCLGDKEIEAMYRNEVAKAQRLGKRQPEEHARQVVLSMARPTATAESVDLEESALIEELTKAFEDYVGDKYDPDKLYPKKHQAKPGKDAPKPKQPKRELDANELVEGLNRIQRRRLSDLISDFRTSTHPNNGYNFPYEGPKREEVIAQIRNEFGDKIANQLESGAYIMHLPRPNRAIGHERLDWSWHSYYDAPRIDKSGKVIKQDVSSLKRAIKGRRNTHPSPTLPEDGPIKETEMNVATDGAEQPADVNTNGGTQTPITPVAPNAQGTQQQAGQQAQAGQPNANTQLDPKAAAALNDPKMKELAADPKFVENLQAILKNAGLGA